MSKTRNLPPDPEAMNDERSQFAEKAIKGFMRDTGADREDALADLLCNFMHWADRQPGERTFADDLERAEMHYREETLPDSETASTDGVLPTLRMTDWPLLRRQKLWLLQHDTPEANGLLHWIDAIQDAVVAEGMAKEVDVFHSEDTPELPERQWPALPVTDPRWPGSRNIAVTLAKGYILRLRAVAPLQQESEGVYRLVITADDFAKISSGTEWRAEVDDLHTGRHFVLREADDGGVELYMEIW